MSAKEEICPACGRMHEPALKECPFCHATLTSNTTIELPADELLTGPKQLRRFLSRERARLMEARRRQNAKPEYAQAEILLMPSAPADTPSKTEPNSSSQPNEKADSVSIQERISLRRFIRDIKRSQSERLNPNWLVQHAAIPSYLLFTAIILFFLMLRVRLEFEFSLLFLLVPITMVLVAFSWMIALHFIELRRRI